MSDWFCLQLETCLPYVTLSFSLVYARRSSLKDSNWRLPCHIHFLLGRCSLELARVLSRVALASHLARSSTPSGVTSHCGTRKCLHHLKYPPDPTTNGAHAGNNICLLAQNSKNHQVGSLMQRRSPMHGPSRCLVFQSQLPLGFT